MDRENIQVTEMGRAATFEQWVEGEGKNADAAIEAAKQQIPAGALDIGRAEITREGKDGVLEIRAFSAEEVHQVWSKSRPEGAILERVESVVNPSNGFFGIGRKLGVLNAYWVIPYKAKISFRNETTPVDEAQQAYKMALVLPIEERLPNLDQSIQYKPDYAEAYYERGNVYAHRGQWDKAIEDYKQAISFQPNQAEAHNNLGQAYRKLHRLTEAIDSFSEALRLKPDFEAAKSNLIGAFSALENFLSKEGQKRYWEAKTSEGRIGFIKFEDFIAAVMQGKVKPDTEVRELRHNLIEARSPLPSFRKLSESLAKMSFKARLLFEPPIWTHSVKGAAIAVQIGIITWLTMQAISIAPINPVISAFILIPTIWALYQYVPAQIKEPVHKVLSKFPFLIILILIYTLRQYNFEWIFKSAMIGLQAQLGAVLAGAILFVFPGMIVGTIVGAVRKQRLPRSPYAESDKPTVFVKGIIAPIIAFAAVIFLYIQFVNWFTAWLERNPPKW
jgi:tetratricopeptide (TPR) repeat protein